MRKHWKPSAQKKKRKTSDCTDLRLAACAKEKQLSELSRRSSGAGCLWQSRVCRRATAVDLLLLLRFQFQAWTPPRTTFNTCSDEFRFVVLSCAQLGFVLQQRQKGKGGFCKKTSRHRKWQLPQLLAGTLIKTKLCFLQWTNMTGAEQRTFYLTPLLPKY